MTTQSLGVRPEWVSDDLFPFESRFIDIDGNTVHYVDEGDGPTLLMYHGNPTWSFLYRGVIAELRRRFRCIAFDYPGFGLSTPAPDYGFTVAEHAQISTTFVEQLGLNDVTAFVQDWGGPIGLGVATKDPQRYRALIIGNTFAWPADAFAWKAMSATLGGPVGRLVVDRLNFLAATVGKVHKLRTLSPQEARHYTAPFPTALERSRTRRFIAQIRGARPYLEALSQELPVLADFPTLLLWGTADMFYKERDLARFQTLFPQHTTHVLDGAGHFIQSEVPAEIAEAVREWYPE